MLANSNLSLISPKSNVNSSGVGGDAPTTTDSFDSVFQQVSGELSSNASSNASSKALPNTNALVSSDVTTSVDADDLGPIINGDGSAIKSDVSKLDADITSGLVALEQADLPNLTGETASSSQGVLSEGISAPALSAISQNAVSSGLVNESTDIGEQSVDNTLVSSGLAGATVLNSEGVGVSVLNGERAEQEAASELVAAQKGLGEGANSERQDGAVELDGQGVSAALGGNLLQSQGANVASLNGVEKASIDTAPFASNEEVGLVAGAALVAGTNSAEESVESLEVKVSDLSTNVTNDLERSDALNSGLVAGAVATGIASSPKSSPMSASTEKVESELKNLNKNDVTKAIQTVSSDEKLVDVTAGLALLGAGAVSHESKSQTVQASNKLAASSAEVVTPELDENADLDWIMQQMSGEKQATVDVGLIPDSIKPQSSVSTINSAIPQSTDSLAKQAAPLSLGLVASESGLLEAGPESELLVEAEVKGGNSHKIEPELARQLDSSGTARSGLGDSLATTGINATQTAATDVKLGVAAAVTNTSNPANMTMQVPPNHPNWSFEMGEKMMWMNKQGIQQAEIHLDPPELGSLTVKVSVDSDVATVSFVAASTQVKDLLEGQVQRLREMMAQQGVELAEVDVNVSQQGSGSQQSGEEANKQFAQNEIESEDADSALMANEARVSRSKVDFYA